LRLEVAEPGVERARAHAFDQPFLIVGRSPEVDLRLDHEEISRRHCYVQMIGGRLIAVDLESRGGIRIDGEVRRAGWIDRGRQLQLGPLSLRFMGGGSATGVSDPRGALSPLSTQYAAGQPPLGLEVVQDGERTYGWPMRRGMALIGRSQACSVRLVDPSVSAIHAALVRTAAGLWIVDLVSREGTYVGGEPIRFARLQPGVDCRLGGFTLRVRNTPSEPSPLNSRTVIAAPEFAGLSDPTLEQVGELLRADEDAATFGSRLVPNLAPAAGALDPSATGGAPGWPPAGGGQDAYHQTVITLAKMLGAMHRDHMNLVHTELQEIRRLAEEMHSLRLELGQRPASAQGAGPDATVPAPAPAAGAPMSAPAHALPEMPAASEPGAPLPADQEPVRRDPRECLAIASSFLAAYEQQQNGRWSRILRLVSGLAQGPGLGADPAR
jgi:pSer/pThr/pTyr-binding forkhead associated (FHA) protein